MPRHASPPPGRDREPERGTERAPTTLTVRPSRLAIAAAIGAAVLTAAHFGLGVVYYLAGWRRSSLVDFFDLGVEGNAPTWFSAGLLLLVAVPLAVLAAAAESRGARFRWGLLAVLATLTSLDEAVLLHERVGNALTDSLELSGVLLYGQVLLLAALVGGLVILYGPWLYRELGSARLVIFLGAASYTGGALGMEMVEGWWVSGGRSAAVLYLLIGIEEMLEMFGAVAVLYGLLLVVRRTRIRLALEDHAPGR